MTIKWRTQLNLSNTHNLCRINVCDKQLYKLPDDSGCIRWQFVFRAARSLHARCGQNYVINISFYAINEQSIGRMKKMTLLIDEVNTLTLSQPNQHILSILSRISVMLFHIHFIRSRTDWLLNQLLYSPYLNR